MKSLSYRLTIMFGLMWIFVAAFCHIGVCGSLNPNLEDNTKIRNGIYSYTHVFKDSSKHLSSRSNIEKRDRIRHDQTHEVIFAVQQKNMDELTNILYDISDPNSLHYGQHWSKDEVTAFTSNPEGRDVVVSYLNSNGASVESETRAGEYITARAPIKVWSHISRTSSGEFILLCNWNTLCMLEYLIKHFNRIENAG